MKFYTASLWASQRKQNKPKKKFKDQQRFLTENRYYIRLNNGYSQKTTSNIYLAAVIYKQPLLFSHSTAIFYK
jgi:hypothetical protein